MSGWLYGQLLAAAIGEARGTEDAAGPFSSGSTDLPGAEKKGLIPPIPNINAQLAKKRGQTRLFQAQA